MFKVPHFEMKDIKTLYSIMEKYPFASIASVHDGKPVLNHLPLTPELNDNGELILWGHMARMNPQWKSFSNGAEITIAFHGPNAFINPSWYQENDAATWNYIIVHVKGIPTLIEDYDGLIKILKKTTDHINHIHEDQWEFYAPPYLESPEVLTKAIIGFSIKPTEISGKFKLSQNRTPEDKDLIMKGLEKRKDESSHSIKDWILKIK